MTDTELKRYYANLLLLQYRGKTNAYATIQALVKPVIMNQLPLAVQSAFDLETAVGKQLDVVGKYQGVTRYGRDFSGPVTLGDADFRQFIKIAIVQNSSKSSLYDIQTLLHTFFPGIIFVFDYQNMRISYYFDSDAIGSQLAEFFVQSGLLPKPMGVRLAAIIFLPTIDNAYGWSGMGAYTAPAYNVHGFNTYSQYDLDCHWINYDDAI